MHDHPTQAWAGRVAGQRDVHFSVTCDGEVLDVLAERVAQLLAKRQGAEGEVSGRSPWVKMDELAEYSGWGSSTIEKLSAANRIPGKVVHDGKVRFHLPTFDAWLLQDHQVGPRTVAV